MFKTLHLISLGCYDFPAKKSDKLAMNQLVIYRQYKIFTYKC